MKRNEHLLMTAILLSLMLLCTGKARGDVLTAELTLNSQAGDPLLQGENFDIIYNSPSDFISPQVALTMPSGEPSELDFSLRQAANPHTSAFLSFGTNELGIPMQPGIYLDAERAAFASPGHP